MNKTIYIIHGWGGSPKEPLHQWLKSELQNKGFEVTVPEMPNPDVPTIDEWINKIKEVIGKPDKDTILVGHSIGCQAILRYLETLHPTDHIGGAVFLAPWITLQNLESGEEWEIAKPWLETEIDDANIIKHIPKMIAIFSDNDPFVSLENKKFFEKRLDAETILESKKGHFTEDGGVTALPSVLEAILAIASDAP